MTLEFLTAIAMQLVALVILWVALRGQLLTHIGGLFVVLAIVFHGVGEVLVRLFPGDNPHRVSITQGEVDRFMLWISLALGVFVAVYVKALGEVRHRRFKPELLQQQLREAGRFYDWRVMATAATPAVAFTLFGQGALAPDAYIAQVGDRSALSQVVGAYLLFATTMAGFSLVARFGRRLLMPVIVGQASALAIVGVRTGVVLGAVILLHAVLFYGVAPTRRQVVGGIALVLFVGLVITAAREQEGRNEFAADKGPANRLSVLGGGVLGIASEATRESVRRTLGYRLDGNSFGTQAMVALDRGEGALGLTPVKNAVLLAVPSALDQGKRQRPPEHQSEKLYAQVRLRLPVRDIIATQLGSTVVYAGVIGMVFSAAFVGLGIGYLDRWLRNGRGPSRLLLSVAAAVAAGSYQGSWQHWTLTARSVLMLLVVVKMIQFAQVAGRRHVAIESRLRAGAAQVRT